MVGLSDLCLLREATTRGPASGSVVSEVDGDAARDGERPCTAGIVRGLKGGSMGEREASTTSWETCGGLSVKEGDSVDDGGSTYINLSGHRGCSLASDVVAEMISIG